MVDEKKLNEMIALPLVLAQRLVRTVANASHDEQIAALEIALKLVALPVIREVPMFPEAASAGYGVPSQSPSTQRTASQDGLG